MKITAQAINGDLISSTSADKKTLGEKLIEFAIIHQNESVQLIAESNPQNEKPDTGAGKETYADWCDHIETILICDSDIEDYVKIDHICEFTKLLRKIGPPNK
jgi:hypothetical protein